MFTFPAAMATLVNRSTRVDRPGHPPQDSVSATTTGHAAATHTSFALNTESTYNWESNDWSVPINLMVTQVFKIGKQIQSLQVGTSYYADTPEGVGPEGWGARLTYTLVFPK